MTLASYTELETEVGRYLGRTDRGAQIQTWVRLVEFDVSRELNLRSQQLVTTGTLASGSDILETPVGVLYPQQLVFDGQPPINVSTVAITAGEETAYNALGAARPIHASVWGATSDFKTQIRVWPPPASNSDYTLYYTTGIAALTPASPTNYLLYVGADLYLFGCLMHGHLYDENAEGAAVWAQPYRQAIAQIKKIEGRARMKVGRLRVRSQYATP
jgi:hypothetical protein